MELVRKIVFNKELMDIMKENMEIFKYEYPNVEDTDWNESVKGKCGPCMQNILNAFKEDDEKLNSIFSKFLQEEVKVYFPHTIESPIVKEFDSLSAMEDYLKELKSTGSMIRNASPSSNGSGGYLLVVM